MDGPCRIRRATPADLAAIHAIERQAFPDAWSASSFLPLFEDVALLAERAGSVVGYAFARAVADEGEIVNLAVDSRWRRQGVARELGQACLNVLSRAGVRRVFLEVREGNAAARALYANLGFREVGRRARYYRKPTEDAVVLRRLLPPPNEAA